MNPTIRTPTEGRTVAVVGDVRLKDDAYRDHVFAYVEREDTPLPLLFQLDVLRQVGFAQIEVRHKNVCFAACGAVKS